MRLVLLIPVCLIAIGSDTDNPTLKPSDKKHMIDKQIEEFEKEYPVVNEIYPNIEMKKSFIDIPRRTFYFNTKI